MAVQCAHTHFQKDPPPWQHGSPAERGNAVSAFDIPFVLFVLFVREVPYIYIFLVLTALCLLLHYCITVTGKVRLLAITGQVRLLITVMVKSGFLLWHLLY